MTNGKIGPRCTAEYVGVSRPILGADASLRLAGQPVPTRDWRCVRDPHSPATEHLAMPAGVTGPSPRFSGPLVAPGTCPTCTTGRDRFTTGMVCQDCGTDYSPPVDDDPNTYHERGVYCGEPAHCFEPHPGADPGTPYPPRPEDSATRTADPDDVRRLIELVQQPGSTAVHVGDGDELLLLIPDATDQVVQRSAQALADLFPTVSFLILAGVTGAVVMPRRAEPTYAELVDQRDRLIAQGVDPDQLLMPERRRPMLPLDDDQAQA